MQQTVKKKGKVKYTGSSEFFSTLKKRVDNYFIENKLSRNFNAHMVYKTIIMLSMYFVPYALIMTNWFSPLAMLPLAILMGIGFAGVGMGVQHDANHGAYSKKNWVNRMLGYTLNAIGGNVFTWKLQHNILHHTYTNVHNMDDDLEAGAMLRFSPHAELKKVHKYQHLYASFFYSILSINWVFKKDFHQLFKYKRNGVAAVNGMDFFKEFCILVGSKLVYYIYFIVLPLVFLDITWWQYIIGFLAVHFTAGFIVSVIFQLAHIVEGPLHPKPDEKGSIENNWAVHQLETTADFARNNKLVTWYLGGLNFQVEHHLFPRICHVHYRALSDIVKQTAKEFNLPYFEKKSFRGAVWSHIRLLRMFGREEKPEVSIAYPKS